MNSDSNDQKIQATADHCAYCFDILLGMLDKKFTSRSFPALPETIPKVKAPLFVTWHKNDDLRGCIGTFATESIEKNLPQYAAISAFDDSRFDPIEKKEVPKLSCAVSLLTDFEKAKDAMDWEVGKHGIEIELMEKGRKYRVTFLPEVAKEQGWDKEETLEYLLKKAGYHGGLKSVLASIQLERYQSSKHELTYNEYLKLRGEGV